MLRPAIKRKIYQILDSNEFFTFNDFITKESKEYEGTTLRIEYEYKPEYYCELKLPDNTSTLTKEEFKTTGFGLGGNKKIEEYQEYVITGKVCPGTLSKTETMERNGKDSFRGIITLWMNNLWQDLTEEPLNRAFSLQKDEIEQIKKKLDSVPEDPFTAEEEESVIERLNKLEEEFKKKIREQFEEKKEIDKRTRELKKEIEHLKMTVSSLNKRGWFKSFATKTFSWLSKPENQKLLKSGKDLVQNLLPEN